MGVQSRRIGIAGGRRVSLIRNPIPLLAGNVTRGMCEVFFSIQLDRRHPRCSR